jgi:hypothetical protein
MNRPSGFRAVLRSSRTWASFAVGACSIVVAACAIPSGSSAHATIRHSQVQTVVGSTAPLSDRPADRTQVLTQIVSAWLSAQRAFGTAALTSDPSEPALAATTVAPQLDWTRALLARMRIAGEISKGPVQYGQPKVVAFSANQAVVQSCEHDAEIAISAASGQPVPGMPGQVDFELFTSTMELTRSGWKLSTQTVGVGQCNRS